jgi:hypothetical protein
MEQKILETLDAIHRLLKSSTALSSGKLPNSRDRAQGNATQREMKDTLRVFRAIGTAGKSTKDAILGLNVSFKELSGEVGKASVNFGSLNSQLAKFMNALQVPDLQADAPSPIAQIGENSRLLKNLVDISEKQLGFSSSMAGSLAGLVTAAQLQLKQGVRDLTLPPQKTDPIFRQLLDINERMADHLASVTALLPKLAPSISVEIPKVDVPAPNVTIPPPIFDVPAPNVTVDPPIINIPAASQVINVEPPTVDVPTPTVFTPEPKTDQLDVLVGISRQVLTALENATALLSRPAPDIVFPEPKTDPIFTELLNVNRQMASSLSAAAGALQQPKVTEVVAPEAPAEQKTDPIFNELLGVNKQMAASLATATSLLGGLARLNVPITVPEGDPKKDTAPVVSAIRKQETGLRGTIGRLFPRRTPAPGPDRAAPARSGRNIDDLDLPMRDVLGRMVERFGRTTSSLSLFGAMLGQISDVLVRLATDFMSIARVGMGSTESLYELSKNALLAGMSLADYVRIMRENSAFASRAGSIEEFDRVTSMATNQLAVLGVFGSEAKELQAVMANSSTMMGISQANLGSSMNAQVALFDKLRKSTNMTAEEFANLVKSVADNDQAQKELLGLAPAARLARQRELLQIASTGQRLGLTAEASKKLADALIAQRGETVKSRVDSAGRIRQMAAFAGMGAEGERAAQIVMKGRAATASELEELRTFASRLDSRSQSMYETGTLGTQNVIDELSKYLGENNFGKLMEANRPAALAQSSGEVFNKQFGQHVSEFGQFVGKLTTIIKGIVESPVGLIAAAVGSALLLAFRGPIMGLLSKVVGSGVGAGAAVAGAAGTAAKTGSVLSRLVAPLVTLKDSALRLMPSMYDIGNAVGNTVKTIGNAPNFLRQQVNAIRLTNAISGPVQTIKFMFQELGVSVGNGAKALLTGTKAAGATIWSGMHAFTKSFGVVGAAFSAVFELFTGDVTAALNPEGGMFNRIGGAVTSFFTAIPNMIIDTLAFIFGDEALGRVRNSFDIIVSFMNMAIKDFFARMIGGLGSLLKRILPDDSKLVKFLESTSEKLQDSAMSNAQTVEALWNDSSKTLSSISEENRRKAEKSTQQATEATNQARVAASKFDSVHYGNQIDANKLLNEGRALVGTPQVQEPPRVAPQPATVNNTETTQDAQQGARDRTAAVNSPEAVAVLQSILQVLNQSLTLEQAQVMALGQMAGVRPKAEFVSAETVAQQLLGTRKGMTS